MEMLTLFAIFYLFRHALTDGIHAYKGTVPPRFEIQAEKLARGGSGASKFWTPIQGYAEALWADSWADATETRRRQRERKKQRLAAGEPGGLRKAARSAKCSLTKLKSSAARLLRKVRTAGEKTGAEWHRPQTPDAGEPVPDMPVAGQRPAPIRPVFKPVDISQRPDTSQYKKGNSMIEVTDYASSVQAAQHLRDQLARLEEMNHEQEALRNDIRDQAVHVAEVMEGNNLDVTTLSGITDTVDLLDDKRFSQVSESIIDAQSSVDAMERNLTATYADASDTVDQTGVDPAFLKTK